MGCSPEVGNQNSYFYFFMNLSPYEILTPCEISTSQPFGTTDFINIEITTIIKVLPKFIKIYLETADNNIKTTLKNKGSTKVHDKIR